MTARRLRAADLARSAGISVQQLRTYLDTGLLPPADRAANGYRVLTGEHAAALRLLRALAAGHGWPRTRAILAALYAGDPATALAHADASHAALDRERAEIQAVRAAVTAAAKTPPTPDDPHPSPNQPTTPLPAQTASHPPPRPPGAAGAGTMGYGERGFRSAARGLGRREPLRIGEVARVTGVRATTLRAWERRGLLRPARDADGHRRYDGPALRDARIAALLRSGGYPFPIVAAVLRELRATGDPARVRAELDAREHDLTARSRRRLTASAALAAYLDDHSET
ncbi:MerR family transcriptional regulator [Actinomadura flavalba]|uniref:MerR family transcriptional regulator n=1 Tax=Actinomadura flavalba TaxID=1120938 RepID=UPI00039E46FF|nr:MerR family transcriptional regulator [Actinomadura flavalba]